jgi:ubiquitin C-terminal hydrolase
LTDYIANPDLPEEYFKDESANANGKRVLYDLIGISNHFGSTGGGHYTAYCK